LTPGSQEPSQIVMRALDTNVLLRFLTQDDSEQAPIATRFVENALTDADPGYVSLPVLCEVAWALRSTYGFGSDEIARAIGLLLGAAQLRIEAESVVAKAVAADADFTDALIHFLGQQAGGRETVTFNRRLARLDGVRLLGAD
jgi:predicted nucleic-acid-binding protein